MSSEGVFEKGAAAALQSLQEALRAKQMKEEGCWGAVRLREQASRHVAHTSNVCLRACVHAHTPACVLTRPPGP